MCGLVGLVFLTIPTWLIIFLYLFSALISIELENTNSFKNNLKYNLFILEENPKEIDKIEIYEGSSPKKLINGLSNPKYNRKRLPVYRIENDNLLREFLKSFKNNLRTFSSCELLPDQKFYWVLTYENELKKFGSFFFYFCKTEEQKLVIGVLDDSNVPMNYFENNEMEKLLKSIGITP